MPAKRFWPKTIRDENSGCWEWTAHIASNGYGRFGLNGKARDSHRVAWELSFGPIPNGLSVLHVCDNRRCVRPDHLFLGTQRDNMIDAVRKGRMKGRNAGITHCQRDHEFTPENTGWQGVKRFCRTCDRIRGRESRQQRRAETPRKERLLGAATRVLTPEQRAEAIHFILHEGFGNKRISKRFGIGVTTALMLVREVRRSFVDGVAHPDPWNLLNALPAGK